MILPAITIAAVMISKMSTQFPRAAAFRAMPLV
jgi:hypothetical protein